MAKEYEVLSITEATRSSETKGLETYYRVKVKSRGGIVFRVDVDEDHIDPAKSAPIILKKAQELDSVLKL